jgi:palmitoyltransferase ZDHHC9/14/18
LGVKKYGNCIGIGPINRPWVTIGPDWPLALCVSCSIFIVQVVFFFFLAGQVGEFVQALGFFFINMTTFNFLYTALRNPGIVLTDKGTSNKRCMQCDISIEPLTEHCSDCGVCVSELDNHCMFMGKCVGRANLWSFYGFLVSLGLTFVYCAVWGLSVAQGAKLLRNRD